MKYALSIFAFFAVVTAFFFSNVFLFHSKKASLLDLQHHSQKKIQPTPMHSTIFVPYWTIEGKAIPTNYNAVAYFGITANTDGINTQEDGYKDIPQFVRSVEQQQKTFLTVRLLDQDVDEKVLHDKAFQQKIISASIATAKQYHFDGIVLDLEYKALAFDEVVQGITTLSNNFANSSHKNNLSFYQALYGDTFYQLRPFDVQAIGKVSDGVFVMAYDFHKANGNPGPNFPLHEMPDAQYSFTQMVGDFTSKVPVQKLSFIFGLFGYDWQLDNKGQSSDEADSLTTEEAEQKFVQHCLLPSCKVTRNVTSSEMEATYVDADDNKHEVWWEDMDSVAQKENYLNSKGIFSTALWAYSYF